MAIQSVGNLVQHCGKSMDQVLMLKVEWIPPERDPRTFRSHFPLLLFIRADVVPPRRSRHGSLTTGGSALKWPAPVLSSRVRGKMSRPLIYGPALFVAEVIRWAPREKFNDGPIVFPQDLDRAVRLLLNKSGDTNRFIRDDAHAALVAVTQYVQPARALGAILGEGLSHKNATVRAEAAKLLAIIVVDRLGPAKSLSGAKDVTDKILPAAAQFIQDGNLEAR